MSPSWIESFVSWGANTETPAIFKKWSGIVSIAAVLEQKVFLAVKNRLLFPNLFVFLVGPPGIGKSMSINPAEDLLRKLPDFHIAPTSVTGASLIDALVSATRILPQGERAYNSMLLIPDELSTLIRKKDYGEDLVPNLTKLYDVSPYSQQRRGTGKLIEIPHPQLSILAGTTTSGLLATVPDGGWDQGFMSRTIMVFANDHELLDDIFNTPKQGLTDELLHDLKCINSLHGQFEVDKEYNFAYNEWRKAGLPPVPTHPRLVHYNARRGTQLLKLSMVSSVDREDNLLLTLADFNQAKGWLLEAEAAMPLIFTSQVSMDSRVMDEIIHFLGKGEIVETKVVRFACERVPTHAVNKMLELMVTGGMIKVAKVDRFGLRYFKAL